MQQTNILPRTFDLIIFGATGFTGRQCVKYFHQHAQDSLRWAVAGRNLVELKKLAKIYDRPFVHADAELPETIDHLCSQTRVILSTAGPFALYSDLVVEKCIEHHTHYTDITGETPWIKSLIDRFHESASQQGTLIIPACGFDSVPSDLGVWLLAQRGEGLYEVDVAFSLKGGLNGGTVASALNIAEQGDTRLLAKRTLLCPEHHQLPEQPYDPKSVRWDTLRERWLIPFFMGPVNTRIVRRTAALLDYGKAFTYQEWMKMSSALKAKVTLGALGLFNQSLRSKLGRTLVKFLAPRPGTGPSEKEIEEGFVKAHFVNRDQDTLVNTLTLKINGDPGNKVTCESVCEVALALVANEQGSLGGVLTPMAGLGATLWNRLEHRGWEVTYEYGAINQ